MAALPHPRAPYVTRARRSSAAALRLTVALLTCATLLACGEDDDPTPTDAGPADVGLLDAPPLDAGCTEPSACPQPTDPCTVAVCGDDGSCSTGPAPDGTSCDDGEPCTADDACAAGSCAAGKLTCACLTTADCAAQEDGDLCNGTLFCDKSGKEPACVVNPATVKSCVPNGSTCAPNVCDAKDGACKVTAAKDDTACDDGNACTQGDVCAKGVCSGTPDAACACQADKDCAGFEDGDLCNGTLYCDTGSFPYLCKVNPGTVVTCPTGGNSCAPYTCKPSDGLCHPVGLPDGATCDADGFPCTADTCAKGTCQQGQLEGKCACNVDADCVQYDNGDVCDGTLYCNLATKTCAVNPATVVTCPTTDDTACRKRACNPITGSCALVNLPAKLPCEDGYTCSKDDACDGKGVCTPGSNSCQCTDSPECAKFASADKCAPSLYCEKPSGVCKGNPATVPVCGTVADTTCLKNLCDPKTGSCAMTPSNEGQACEADGSVCTTIDTCQQGKCEPASNTCPCKSDADCADKDDGDKCNGTLYCNKVSKACEINPTTVVSCKSNGSVCLPNVCDPKDGTCKATAVTDGTKCETDDFFCTQERCKAGKCEVSVPENTCLCWEDGDCAAITLKNQCVGTLYCDKTANAGKQPVCKLNKGTAVSCGGGDGTSCDLPACDPATGKCTATQKAPDGVGCDDGDVCTKQDLCAKGLCAGTPEAAGLCDDKIACTVDSCNPKTGCVHLPNPSLCDDGNGCTTGECDPKTGCTHLPNSATCTDNDACTSGDGCAKGTCVPGAPVSCDDNKPCTTDSCDPKGAPGKACVYTPNTAACDDGDACTTQDTCDGKGGCKGGGALACDDGDVCTSDSCDPKTGCTTTALNTGSCDDGSSCTTSDVCTKGVCTGTAVSCDDGNPCTKDTCDPKAAAGKGCSNEALTGPTCDDGSVCTQDDGCNKGKCVGDPVVCADKGDCKASSCDPKTGCQYSGKAEVCNGLDDDCDNVKDNGCDDDQDGFCDSKMAVAPGATCTGSASWQGGCAPTHPAKTFAFAESRKVTLSKPFTGFGYGGYDRYHDEFLMLAIVPGQTAKTSTVWRFDPQGERLGRRVVPAPTVLSADADAVGPDLFLGSASGGAVRVDGANKVVWAHTASGTQASQIHSDGSDVWVAFGATAAALTKLSRGKGDKLGTLTLAYAQSGVGAFASHRGLAVNGGKVWHVGGAGALVRYDDKGALEATVSHKANDAFQAVFTGRELCLLQQPAQAAKAKTLICYLVKPPTCTTAGDDCDDTLKGKNPAAVEVCDGKDDDCDGKADQDCDRDGDKFCAAHKDLTAGAACTKSQVTCPSGGVVAGGHCYWSPKGDVEKLSFPAAKAACEQLGAHLVTVADAAENDVVAQAATGAKILSTFVWLGLAPPAGGTGKHTWVDGTPLGYVNWSGTPNPQRAGAFGRSNKTWATQLTNSQFAYVCEREPAMDCADVEPLAFPGATEVCDGVDDNCDESVDDGCDADGDGFCGKGRKVLAGAVCTGSTGDESGCARAVCQGNTGNAHCGWSGYALPTGDKLTGTLHGMHHRFRDELWLTRPEGAGWKVARYLGRPQAAKAGQSAVLTEINRFSIANYANVEGLAAHPTKDRWVLCHGNVGGAPLSLFAGADASAKLGVFSTTGNCRAVHAAGDELFVITSQDQKKLLRIKLDTAKLEATVSLATTGKTPIALGRWPGGWLYSNAAQQLGVYADNGTLSHTLFLSSHSPQGFQWGDKMCMQKIGANPALDCFNVMLPDCAAAGDDCDDNDKQVHPGPETLCDGKDDSCDGLTDEGCDPDGDGYCDAKRTVTEQASCAKSFPAVCKGGVTLGGSCYKAFPRNSAHRKNFAQAVAFCKGQGGHLATITSADEQAAVWAAIGKQGGLQAFDFWRIGLSDPDSDKAYTWIDGSSSSYSNWEEGSAPQAGLSGIIATGGKKTGQWTVGSLTLVGYMVCEVPVQRDCDESDQAVNPGATELCDGKDNSCAGSADTGCDVDQDGYCAAGKTVLAGSVCSKPGDCGDDDKAVYPGATELCDGKDNDCNATTDDGCDADGDGYCAAGKTVLAGATCSKTAPSACVISGSSCFRSSGVAALGTQAKVMCGFSGTGQTTAVITSPTENAAVQAVLKGAGATEGYLGLTDLGTDGTYVWGATQKVATWLNFAANGKVAGSKGVVSMVAASGQWKESDGSAKHVAVCQSALAFDCDESNASVNPGVFAEICDGKDNNCNGTTDEGCDDDGDGYCDKDRGVLPGALCTKSFGPTGKCAGYVAKTDTSKITLSRQVTLKDASGKAYSTAGDAWRHQGRKEWWAKINNTWARYKDDGSFVSTFSGAHLTPNWVGSHDEDAVFVFTGSAVQRFDGLGTTAKWTTTTATTHEGRISYDQGKLWLTAKGTKALACLHAADGKPCDKTYPIQTLTGDELTLAVVHLGKAYLNKGKSTVQRYDVATGKADGTFALQGSPDIAHLHATDTEVCTREKTTGLAPRCYGTDRAACATGGDDCNDHAKQTNPATPEVCNGKDENCDGIKDDGCDDDQDGFCDASKSVVPGALCTKSFSEGQCDEHVAAPPGQQRFAFMAGKAGSVRAKWHAYRKEWWVKDGNAWSRHAPDGKLLGTFNGGHLINEASWCASHDEDAVFVRSGSTLRRYAGVSNTAVWSKQDNDYSGVPSYDEGLVWLRRAGTNSLISADPKTGTKGTKVYTIALNSGHKLDTAVVHLGKVWIVTAFYETGRYDLLSGKYELKLNVPGKFNSHLGTSETEICAGDTGAGHVGRCWVVAASTCPGGKGDDCDDTSATVKPVAVDSVCDGKDDNCDGTTDEGCDADGDGFCGGAKPVVQGALCTQSFGSDGKCTGLKSATVPPDEQRVALFVGSNDGTNAIGTAGPHPFRQEWWSRVGSSWNRHKADGSFIGTFAGSHLGDIWAGSDSEDAVVTVKSGKLTRFNGLSSAPVWSLDAVGQIEGQVSWSAGKVWVKITNASSLTAVTADEGDGGGNPLPIQLLAGHSLSTFTVAFGKVFVSAGTGKAYRYDLATGKAEVEVKHTTGAVSRYSVHGDRLCAHAPTKELGPYCVRVAEPFCSQQGDDCADSDKTRYPGSKELCDNKDDNCDGEVDDGCDDDGDGYCDGDHVVSSTAVCAKSLPAVCAGGVLYKGKCYKGYKSPTKKWADARTACIADGGDLATAVDAGERAAVEAAAEKADPGGTNWWLLGAAAPPTNKSYAWITGVPFADTNWKSGEPKNTGGVLAFQPGPIGKNLWITLATGGLASRVCAFGLLLDCDDSASARQPGGTEQTCDNKDDNCDGATDEGCDDDKDGYCAQGRGVTADAKCSGTLANPSHQCNSLTWVTPKQEDLGTPSKVGRNLEQSGAAHSGWHGYRNEWWVVRAKKTNVAGQITRVSRKGVTLGTFALPGTDLGVALAGSPSEDSWFATVADHVVRRNGLSGVVSLRSAKLTGARALSFDHQGRLWVHKHSTAQFWLLSAGTGQTLTSVTLTAPQDVGAPISGVAMGQRVLLAYADKSAGSKILQWRGYSADDSKLGQADTFTLAQGTFQPRHAIAARGLLCHYWFGSGLTSCMRVASVGCTQGDDCDDSTAGVNPGAIELCDGKDNDCDNSASDCSDGDPCTQGDACNGASCTAQPACDDDNPCTLDSCDKSKSVHIIKGCQYAAATNGAACDDGKVCTATSACQNGVCVGQSSGGVCGGTGACTGSGDCNCGADSYLGKSSCEACQCGEGSVVDVGGVANKRVTLDGGTVANVDSFAYSGGRLVLGASAHKTGGGGPATGGVRVFERTGGGGFAVKDAVITPQIPTGLGEFGVAVALHDDLLAVGQPGASQNAVHIYKPDANSGAYSLLHTLQHANNNPRFGSALASCEDRLYIGAPNTTVGGNANAGRVFASVKKSNGTFAKPVGISLSPSAQAALGAPRTLACQNSQLYAGAPGDEGQGAVWVLNAQGGTSHDTKQKIVPPGAGYSGSQFGMVGVSGRRLIVGAPGFSSQKGIALVYAGDTNGTYKLVQTLSRTAHQTGERVGHAVALAGDTALVGVPGRVASAKTGAGMVEVWRWSGAAWTYTAQLAPKVPSAGHEFGATVGFIGADPGVGFAPNHSGAHFEWYRLGTGCDAGKCVCLPGFTGARCQQGVL